MNIVVQQSVCRAVSIEIGSTWESDALSERSIPSVDLARES